jgi:hypothetical protein
MLLALSNSMLYVWRYYIKRALEAEREAGELPRGA